MILSEVPTQYWQTTPSRVTFWNNASTAPAQTFSRGIILSEVPPQYWQTTPSRVTFWNNASTEPFGIQYHACTAPVPEILRRYWRSTEPIVNFYLGRARDLIVALRARSYILRIHVILVLVIWYWNWSQFYYIVNVKIEFCIFDNVFYNLKNANYVSDHKVL